MTSAQRSSANATPGAVAVKPVASASLGAEVICGDVRKLDDGQSRAGERPSLDQPDLPKGAYEFVMETEVESDDDPVKIRHVVKCAKQGCFAEQMVVKPVPLVSTMKINGEAYAL